jgi:hypothetical protein
MFRQLAAQCAPVIKADRLPEVDLSKPLLPPGARVPGHALRLYCWSPEKMESVGVDLRGEF